MSAAHLPATHLRIRSRYSYEQQRQCDRQSARLAVQPFGVAWVPHSAAHLDGLICSGYVYWPICVSSATLAFCDWPGCKEELHSGKVDDRSGEAADLEADIPRRLLTIVTGDLQRRSAHGRDGVPDGGEIGWQEGRVGAQAGVRGCPRATSRDGMMPVTCKNRLANAWRRLWHRNGTPARWASNSIRTNGWACTIASLEVPSPNLG